MAYGAPETEGAAGELPDLDTRVRWVEDWEEATKDARKEARTDRDYYDNKQWTKEEVDELGESGQPVLTKNRIAPKINFVLGDEIEKRVDPVALPRTPKHQDVARAVTDALRFVDDEQEFDRCRSAVFKNAVIEGYGGAVKEVEQASDGRPRHRLRHVEWDRLGYDPHSRDPLFRDAKYKFVLVWLDIDDAVALYPDAEKELRQACASDSAHTSESTDDVPRRWVDGRRKRLRIIEMYFKIGNDWYRSDFTQSVDLAPPEPTGLLDELGEHYVCPLAMVSCYVDANGMRYGLVRPLRSPQDEINKRSSKALHLLNVRQVTYEDGAVPDIHNFQSELAKPDGAAMTNPGALADRRVQVNTTADLAQGQVLLLEQAKQDIDRIGPSAAQLPGLPADASGRAQAFRHKAAAKELGGITDHLRWWTLEVYTLDYLCIRQYWSEETWLRVTDDDELTGYRFVALNQRMTRAQRLQDLLQKQPAPPLPKAVEIAAGIYAPLVLAGAQAQMRQLVGQAQASGLPPPQGPQMEQIMLSAVLAQPLMAEEIKVNQVDQAMVDIIIEQAPDTAVIEQEEFEKFASVAPALLQGGMSPREVAKMVVRLSQLRDKREVLKMLEQGPSPQQVAAQQQAQQLQMEQIKAGIAVTQTQARLNAARADSEQAQTQIAGAKTPSEIEKNQASAMRDAASAGNAAGGI